MCSQVLSCSGVMPGSRGKGRGKKGGAGGDGEAEFGVG